MVKLWPGRGAAGCLGDLGECVVGEMLTHVFAGNVPDREEDTVPFMVTRTVLMRLTEVAEGDRSIGCSDDVGESDLLGALGEHVAAADTALGLHEPGAFQDEEDLFEVRLGESCACGDVPNRGRSRVISMERK